jgi:hypothetical protein
MISECTGFQYDLKNGDHGTLAIASTLIEIHDFFRQLKRSCRAFSLRVRSGSNRTWLVPLRRLAFEVSDLLSRIILYWLYSKSPIFPIPFERVFHSLGVPPSVFRRALVSSLKDYGLFYFLDD